MLVVVQQLFREQKKKDPPKSTYEAMIEKLDLTKDLNLELHQPPEPFRRPSEEESRENRLARRPR